jgi:acetoin utilization deacetylase AcuC-like enzyme
MTSPKKTGFVYHDDYLKHDTGQAHPERPQRLKASIEALQTSDFWATLYQIEPRPATVDQIYYVHTRAYVDQVKRHCEQGIPLDYDTPVSPASFDVALLSTGGVLSVVDAVMAGTVSNAFALVRPPGHHAHPNRSMGFCLFNNIAITARYLQREHGIGRVAIVDWDVHHGNGTQDIFYDDPSVFFFSIHQGPLYPGTGMANEVGVGEAVGTTLNAPMRLASDASDYIKIFQKRLKPVLLDFSPDFLLISAGFDAHRLDPLASINMTAEGFARLTDIVAEIAAETCERRLVSALEGGYNLKGVSESVIAHVERLLRHS